MILTCQPSIEHILRILGEATEALFVSDIAEPLNKELRSDSAVATVEVATHMRGITDQVANWLTDAGCSSD